MNVAAHLLLDIFNHRIDAAVVISNDRYAGRRHAGHRERTAGEPAAR